MKFYLILLLFLIACQPAKKNLNLPNDVNHEMVIEEKLGGKPEYLTSADGVYLLCRKVDKSHPGKVDFLVYHLPGQKIVYQERLENGKVAWENNTTIKITQTLGNRTEDYPEGYRIYYYDVAKKKTMEKAPKNN